MEHDECRECGALVASASRHRAWHTKVDRKVGDLETQLEEVQQTADYAANVLYQRGID